MGSLHYGVHEFSFDDRLLAHLQIVVSTKLRRGESFFLAWRAPKESGRGRHALWIDNGVPIHFEYSGSRPPAINREWVEQLALEASSSSGLIIKDLEPPADPDEG